MVSLFLLNAFYGSIAGFAWAFALHKQPYQGLIYGVTVGIIIGLVLYVMNKAAMIWGVKKGQASEASFVTNMQSTLLVIATITMALATWIIRLIFF